MSPISDSDDKGCKDQFRRSTTELHRYQTLQVEGLGGGDRNLHPASSPV